MLSIAVVESMPSTSLRFDEPSKPDGVSQRDPRELFIISHM